MDEANVVSRLGSLDSENDGVTVRFEGEAYAALTRLMSSLGVDTERDVVLKGVELLLAAEGKEVLLRSGNTTQKVRLWARR